MKKSQLRFLVKEVLSEEFDDTAPEVLSRDRGDYDEAPDPMDSEDDVGGDRMSELEEAVDQYIQDLELNNDKSLKAFENLQRIYETLSANIDNVEVKYPEDKVNLARLEKAYQPIMSKIYPHLQSMGDRPERFQERKQRSMKKEFLELLIRECVSVVLKTTKLNEDTVGAPAPPENDQGTADTSGLPKDTVPTVPSGPTVPLTNTARGVFFVDPRKAKEAGYKGDPLKTLAGKDQAQMERELYRIASRMGGPRIKISGASLREIPAVLAGQIPATFLYIGKQDPEDSDEEIYLLPVRTLDQAKQGSVSRGTSAEHPETSISSDDQTAQGIQTQAQAQAQGGKTLAPDIDEANSLKGMIASMVKETLREIRKQ